MNMKIAASLALLGCAIESSMALFLVAESTAATAATTSTLSLAGGTGTALALGGGILLLKGLALGAVALAAANNRGRRAALEVNDSDAAFAVLATTEPAQCYRRLICDLATGTMPKSQNEIILNLFNKEAEIESPRFDYAIAAKLGKQVKNTKVCEIRYSCPLTGSQIQSLFA